MKKHLRLLLPALAGLVSIALAQTVVPAPAPPRTTVDASAPLPKRGNAHFYELHASFLKRAKEGPIGVLFLGDSITEGWTKAPEVWQEHFGKYQPANFGISGDQTQHVLWRIEDGELDGIKPKVVVLMIGTNNTTAHTAEQITAADRRIVSLIRAKLPEAKVLLLAVFPRGPRQNSNGTPDTGVERMAVIAAVNAELAKLDDGAWVRFLDINTKFLGADGKIPETVMPDQLHPSAAGYKLWAEAMQPLLDEMMR